MALDTARALGSDEEQVKLGVQVCQIGILHQIQLPHNQIMAQIRTPFSTVAQGSNLLLTDK